MRVSLEPSPSGTRPALKKNDSRHLSHQATEPLRWVVTRLYIFNTCYQCKVLPTYFVMSIIIKPLTSCDIPKVRALHVGILSVVSSPFNVSPVFASACQLPHIVFYPTHPAFRSRVPGRVPPCTSVSPSRLCFRISPGESPCQFAPP